ncbi:hypothetical protein F2Q68_00020675 [Brassica cretica]|uniref:Uncharacterized protein n=1 Tax=Brassica cretica TaxID=69181 RepID=A0A8S9FWB0_BRACR|nr:hypothetical protein F2Q68_00020675 [Brassica cretica]
MSSSHGDKRSTDVEMGEATSLAPIPTSLVEAPACVADHLSFREKLVRSVVPDASALPAGSSTTPILVEDKERAADSMPPPPARKKIILALRAPSVVPVAKSKGRKRKFTKGGDRESSQQGDSSIASGLRGKIDGMIRECGSETSRLAGKLLELQGRWSETEAMLTAVKDSHSVKVSKLEVAIGELEKDLGKTASSLLKEKKARKAKSSEVHRLQRQIEGDAGLASRGIREAKYALRSEFQARLAKISAFLGSLECIRNRDLALATIEGGMAVVQSFQSETPLTLEAEDARLSGCKGDLAVVDGDFDLILADLKSVCFLPTCSEGPEGYRLRGISEDAEYKHRGIVLGSRIFWISCLEMLETSALGLGQDLDDRVAFFISLRMAWKKGDELSSHILLRCEMFCSRSVSRVFPRDIDFAGYLEMSNKHRGMVLGSRIFWISCLEMLETSALGLGQDLGLLSVLRFYAVTSWLSIYLL